MGNKARFLPSESVRRAEVAMIDAIAAICAEHELGYQLIPAESGQENRVSLRLELYPDPSLPFEHLVMRRTYHWICRCYDLPYDLPGKLFRREEVVYNFLGASLDTPPKKDQHFFLALNSGTREIVRLTADEVRAEVVANPGDPLSNVHFGVGLSSISLPTPSPAGAATA